MKIQCSVCQAAEAAVFCCADEAALCLGCDQSVHAANRVAGKHRRVPLSSSSSKMPKCDICQETVGYFFCLEDRALLCRKCDVAIHTATSLVSKHQRYLLTGVQVDLEATELGPSSSTRSNNSTKQILEVEPRSVPKRAAPISSSSQHCKIVHIEAGVCDDFSSPKSPFAGGSSAGNISPWQLDEFIEFGDFAQSYPFMDNCSFQENNGKPGGIDEEAPILQVARAELAGDGRPCQPVDTLWAVPQIPTILTPPAVSWPKNYQIQPEFADFGPEELPMQNHHRHHQSHNNTISKRRRPF